MQNVLISENEALNLCQKVEDHFFEKKGKDALPKNIEKIAVAFANSDGGNIIIGIKNGSGEKVTTESWHGTDSPENYNSLLQALYNLAPALNMSASFLSCKGLPGYVLSIQIEKGTQLHATSDGKVYVRRGAQSLPLQGEKIVAFSYTRGIMSYENAVAPDAILENIVDGSIIKDFCDNLPLKIDPLSFLVNEQLIDPKTWNPRVATILLFTENPSPILASTRCGIRISRYTTKEEEAERDHLLSTDSIEGTLYNQITDATKKVRDLLSGTKIWTTAGREQVQYPPESLWEVIANAVIHRDYSASDDIQIHVYDNRVVVASPGKLPGIISVDNILTERFSRNPKIVRTLARHENPPNKDLGEGLNTAFQKMKDWKLKSPVIEEKGNYVYVTLAHTSLARPEEIVLEYLTNHSSIKNKIARELTGIKSENSMKAVFKKLEAAGELMQHPDKHGAAAEWIRPPKNN